MGMARFGRSLTLVLVALATGALAGHATGSLTPVERAETKSARTAAPAPSTAPPTTVPPTAPPTPEPACSPDPSLSAPPTAPAPAELAAALAAGVADPRLTATDYGVSIWVDGYGEVAAHEPDQALLPASNQKILTGMGALAVLGADATLSTTVRATGPLADGTVTGDLVLAAGGDPTLATTGPHSLDALAAQVRAAGVIRVTGALVVDESRYDTARRAAGWQDWQVPAYAGSLSALMVDRNRHRGDPAFLADPALGNAELFRAALARHGVAVGGPTTYGVTPAGAPVLGSLTSAPMSQLVADALLRSDNMMAELLVKEIGLQARGTGSTADGLAAIADTLSGALCIHLTGVDDDGSGLSRADLRSPREWRTLLQAARSQPWWQLFDASLPLAGRSGTLAGRFRGTAAEGNMRAKTGTIIGGVALSGYGTTTGGRLFVFSVVANGPAAGGAAPAIDALVAAVARWPY
jgi:serine-type D-Ala-D-Ala carboxypeptidase/endopeptidase (penicillin-binding protein 4)